MGSIADEKGTSATEVEHDAVYAEKAAIQDFKASAIEVCRSPDNLRQLEHN